MDYITAFFFWTTNHVIKTNYSLQNIPTYIDRQPPYMYGYLYSLNMIYYGVNPFPIVRLSVVELNLTMWPSFQPGMDVVPSFTHSLPVLYQNLDQTQLKNQ